MAIGELFIGGDAPYPAHRLGPPPAVTVAADSGYGLARRLGRPVDVLVGDLDSITPADLDHARSARVTVEEHARDKDATDLELAVGVVSKLAADLGTRLDELLIYGGLGGRLDHLLAVIDLAAVLHDTGISTTVLLGPYEIVQLRAGTTHTVTGGHDFSIRPAPGRLTLTISGARWPLTAETLTFGSGRGLGNRSLATGAEIHCLSGVGAVITTADSNGGPPSGGDHGETNPDTAPIGSQQHDDPSPQNDDKEQR